MNVFKPTATLILLLVIILFNTTVSMAQEKAADSKTLRSTIITPQLESEIKPGKNLIFCNTFQLAWNQLTDNIIKGDLHLSNEPPVVKILNKMRKIITTKDLSEKYYLAMAGYGKDNIVNKINKAMQKKFGKEAWLLDEKLNPDDILAFAFLMKNLKFKAQFDDSERGMKFNSSDVVKSFGIQKFNPGNEKMNELSRQVEILHYNKDKKEYIVRLISESPDDELILARVEPGKNLWDTVEKVDGAIKTSIPEKLKINDILQIPEIDFFIEHSYVELLSRHFTNKGFRDYFISKAMQVTKFKLDKTGATLKSKAVIVATRSIARGMKVMVFDKPFMLILREKKSKNPYFVVWVDNPEILVKR